MKNKPDTFPIEPIELTDIKTVGTIIGYASDIPPDGWSLCDGSYFDKTKAPELHKLLKSEFLPFIPTENGRYSIIRHDGKEDPSTILDITNWVAVIPSNLNSGARTRTSPLALGASGSTMVAGFESAYASISNDSGKTWTSLPRGLNSGSLDNVGAIASSGSVFIVGFKYGRAARSDDYGRTWTQLPHNLNAVDSSLNQSITSIAGSGNTFVAGLLTGYSSISKDAGKTWTKLDLKSKYYLSTISAITAYKNVFVLATEGGQLLRSENYGLTWEELPRCFGVPGLSTKIHALASSNGTFIGTLGEGYSSISHDFGKNWDMLPKGLGNPPEDKYYPSIKSLAVYGNTFIAGFQRGYASISTNSGRTWKPLPRSLNTNVNADIICLAAAGSTFISGSGYTTGSTCSRGTPGPETYFNPNAPAEMLTAENKEADKDLKVISLYRTNPEAAFEKLLLERVRGYDSLESLDKRLDSESDTPDTNTDSEE